jgi:hypothetical protein
MLSVAEFSEPSEEPRIRRTKNFSISKFGKNILKRSDTIQDVERDYNNYVSKVQPPRFAPSPLPIPARTSSMVPAKRLVARGGNERAVPIVIPDYKPKDMHAMPRTHRKTSSESSSSSSYSDRRPHKLQRYDAACRITSVA